MHTGNLSRKLEGGSMCRCKFPQRPLTTPKGSWGGCIKSGDNIYFTMLDTHAILMGEFSWKNYRTLIKDQCHSGSCTHTFSLMWKNLESDRLHESKCWFYHLLIFFTLGSYTASLNLALALFVCLFFKDFIYLLLERREWREKERERNINVWLPLVHPLLGTRPAPRHVPWLEIESATLCFAVRCSIHWATPATAGSGICKKQIYICVLDRAS